MPFDEEHIDPHGECAAEIRRLQEQLAEARAKVTRLQNILNQDGLIDPELDPGKAINIFEAAVAPEREFDPVAAIRARKTEGE